MQKLNDNHGFPTVQRALRYTSIRLRSRPETADLAGVIDAERTSIETANDTHEQAREERVAATAEIDYLDGELDLKVMDLSRQVAVLTGSNTSDERYKMLFPVAPSKAVKPTAGESQHRFVKILVDRLENDKRFEALRGNVKPIVTAQTDLEKAIVNREECYMPEMRVSTDLKVAIDKAGRTYNKLYPQLTLIFDNERLVESFFLKIRKSRKSGGDTDEPTVVETATE